jgi:hypothetical protein
MKTNMFTETETKLHPLRTKQELRNRDISVNKSGLRGRHATGRKRTHTQLWEEFIVSRTGYLKLIIRI